MKEWRGLEVERGGQWKARRRLPPSKVRLSVPSPPSSISPLFSTHFPHSLYHSPSLSILMAISHPSSLDTSRDAEAALRATLGAVSKRSLQWGKAASDTGTAGAKCKRSIFACRLPDANLRPLTSAAARPRAPSPRSPRRYASPTWRCGRRPNASPACDGKRGTARRSSPRRRARRC